MLDAVPSGIRGGRGAAAANAPTGVVFGDVPTRAPRRPANGRALTALLVLGAMLLTLLSSFGGSAGAATITHAGLVRLPGSVTPSLSAQARSAGAPVPASRRLHLTVTLRPRNPAALAAYANAVSTPGSGVYRRYLTPGQFGRRFGAPEAQVRSVRSALTRQGLSPGRLAAGRLSIPLVSDARTLERGLDVQLRTVHGSGGRDVVTATRAPALAAGAAAGVQSIVGLDSSAAPRPLSRHAARTGPLTQPLAAATSAPGADTTDVPKPCHAATAAVSNFGGWTDNQIADAYGFTPLYQAGDAGAGTTVAVYELEPNSPQDIQQFEQCYGLDTSVSYVKVDGGAGRGTGSDEAAFDIENLIAFAPSAKVLVYQGHNAQSGAPGSGPFDTFAAIVNQDRAQVVSVSWGGCEAQLGRASATAEHTLFQQAAIQGQTIVAADGDDGAQDCRSSRHPNAKRLAVDDPAAQPFVTAVGGTTLQSMSPTLYQTAWNSHHESAGASSTAGATGGGVSSFWAMPPSQSHAAKALGVATPAASGSHCGRRRGYCREVPDVSIDGDPTTGYAAYWNGTGSVGGAQRGWQVLGGTSGAAPVWAALIALADSSPACHGKPIGFANPALYRAASRSYKRDFHDVLTGNNAFWVDNRGFEAKGGYDPVTGLGTPDASPLVASLCAATISVSAVTPKQTPVGTQVSLRMHATDVHGAALRWSAKGLPPGLKLGESSGRITGRTKRAGTYTVRATASDGQNATATVRFEWTITKETG